MKERGRRDGGAATGSLLVTRPATDLRVTAQRERPGGHRTDAMRFPLGTEDDAWLRERVRLEHPGRSDGGRFVLAWLVAALRAQDNPVLDAARRYAARRGLPLLVYQGLTARAWYASDRTHAFILQGAADLARDLARDGLRHALHLDADGRSKGLAALTAEAHAVFTDELPVGPFPRWRAALARATGRPLWTVDAACVLPMRVVGRAYERAFAFREATHASRVARIHPSLTPTPTVPAWEGPLPFDAVDPARMDIAEALAAMRIDHGVAPVPGLKGGAHAARSHWDAWRSAHLGDYAARRTDASDATGASLLSPWIHFGMIAPWRIAAEAEGAGAGAGAEKFLDELLTWRELAWCFCAHRPDHAMVTALPAWARESLEATRARRATRPSLAAIARGETGDALFDLAQRSLLRRGVLHNNARMTWGRTLAAWFDDPAEGLAVIEALNHRYALDGRDPASYGGILWCYGQFDRPQGASGPLGAVQSRSGAQHLRRLDVARYRAWIDAPRRPTVVVVGAGVAGLVCAASLAAQGAAVTVLDKGRAPGGRLATRRTERGVFDHGAQFVTLRDPRMARHRARWTDAGAVRPWFDDALRGSSGMSSLARHLAEGLPVTCDLRVSAVARSGDGWVVRADDGRVFAADAVVLTAPVPQSLALVDAGGVALDDTTRARLAGVTYAPCLAGMFAGAWPDHLAAHGVARVDGDVLAWLASNAAKGISPTPTLTAHARADWSEARWGDADDDILAALGAAVASAIGGAVTPVALKRWRYARPTTCLDGPVVHREGRAALVFTGDAFDPAGARVEGAALAGLAAAGCVLTPDALRA